MMKRRPFLLSALALGLILPACQSPAGDDIHVYLVRHAEKAKGDDPGLTDAGKRRADALQERLKGKGVDYIHSSDYRRTRETAAPLAAALKQEVLIYDAGDLFGVADDIKGKPGTHLVVGHSNTTPELAAILSGQLMEAMDETEYNRFIEVRLTKDGELIGHKTVRYGADN